MESAKVEKLVKSKIVCTIGPATSSAEMLQELDRFGADVFRLNFSHASEGGEEMIELFNRIRKFEPAVGILCDIQGPKIRVGQFEEQVTLTHGNTFKIYEQPVPGTLEQTNISYKGFLKDVSIGNSIFINDGLVRLEVIDKKVDEGYVLTKVIAGGPIGTRKGVNIPSGNLSTRNPTEKDLKDLRLIAKLQPEFVAASFVANASEVNAIRNVLRNEGAARTKIIAKIERPVALLNFDEILAASDGIMVARGDLGVEIPAEEVPIRQKEMIMKCNRAGKPVIVATQMLESMTGNPVPTRAEVNDVFNAVYDRSDAVMLSGETSVGKFPLKAVEVMDRIINKAENYIPPLAPSEIDSDEPEMYEAVGHAVYELAQVFSTVNFRGKIVMFTRGGKSCRMVAKYRPKYPILAITNNSSTARILRMVWGVQPYYVPDLGMEDLPAEKIMQEGIADLVKWGILEEKEHVICTVPSRISPGRCSVMGLYYVSDLLKDIKITPEAYAPNWEN